MSVTKSLVFLASNFNEFRDLREKLRRRINASPLSLEAVDLNQNEPSDRSALDHSLRSLRRSEVMILLLGEVYGGTPTGEGIGYTHQEYRAAIADGSTVRVLPFLIGPSYREKRLPCAADSRLADWQREVSDNHTVSFFTGAESFDEEIVPFICRCVEKLVFDRVTEEEQRRIELAEADLEEGLARADDSLTIEPMSEEDREQDDLARKYVDPEALKRFDGLERLPRMDELMGRPAETAAREQREEAAHAMKLGDRLAAIHHLRAALQYRMLDWHANYWLARLLLRSDRKKDFAEALQLTLRAERMASSRGEAVPRSLSLLLAAQAAARLEDLDAALDYARQAAKDVTPWYARAVAGLACQYALRGELDEAFAEARRAFFRHPPALLSLNREPAFQRYPREFRTFKRQFREELRAQVERLLHVESEGRRLIPPTEKLAIDPAEREYAIRTMAMLDLVREGRASVERTLKHLRYHAQACAQEARSLMTGGILPTTADDVVPTLQKWDRWRMLPEPALAPMPGENPVFGLLYWAFGGMAAVSSLVAVGGFSEAAPSVGVVGLSLCVVGLAGLGINGLAHSSANQSQTEEAQRRKLTHEQHLREWNLARSQGPRLDRLLSLLKALTQVAREYEAAVTDWQLFCPRGRLEDSRIRAMVRLKGSELPSGWIVDRSLLPPRLQHLEVLLGGGTATGPCSLVRVQERTAGGGAAARWACYFDG